MRRFLTTFVPPVGEMLTLDDSTSHHLLRVTGIAPEERVEIFDGQGGGGIAELVEVREGLAVLRVLKHRVVTQRCGQVHLLLAQTRANVLDTTLRMVTELGVGSVQIVVAERCVAKGDKRERWLRIMEAAAAQSGGVTVPELMAPMTIRDAIASRTGARLVLSPGSEIQSGQGGDVSLLVGPEGGLTDEELRYAEEAGWVRAGLGETTLRADTAAVAAVVRYGS